MIRKNRKIIPELRKHSAYYLLLLPLMAYFIIFCYGPMYGVLIAFQEFRISKGVLGSQWVGFSNFIDLFSSYSFKSVFANTVIISLLRTIFGFWPPILFALLLNEIRFTWFKKTVQTISYLPHFISWVILSGIIKNLLSPTRGAVNAIISLFGGTPIYFLTEPSLFRSILVVSGIWQGIGWGSIIYLSAIASIDVEQYEAARIEGSNRLQNMRYITIPSILPVISILFILGMAGILNGGFDQVYNLYNDTVMSVADIIDTYVYRKGLVDMNYSFSAAVGLFKNIIGLIFVLLTNAVVKRLSEDKNVLW